MASKPISYQGPIWTNVRALGTLNSEKSYTYPQDFFSDLTALGFLFLTNKKG